MKKNTLYVSSNEKYISPWLQYHLFPFCIPLGWGQKTVRAKNVSSEEMIKMPTNAGKHLIWVVCQSWIWVWSYCPLAHSLSRLKGRCHCHLVRLPDWHGSGLGNLTWCHPNSHQIFIPLLHTIMPGSIDAVPVFNLVQLGPNKLLPELCLKTHFPQ